MQQFEIILKNYKLRSYRFFAFFLVCFNVAVYFFLLMAHAHFYEIAIASFLIFFYCIYRVYLHKKNKENFFIDAAAFFVMASCWLVVSNYLMAVSCVLLGALYYFASQKIIFIFNDHFIKKVNFPKAIYPWNMLTNVILRDAILTLDFTNNKLIQAEIEDEQSINETMFNNFAQQHVTSFAL